jgi:hypothetical protein
MVLIIEHQGMFFHIGQVLHLLPRLLAQPEQLRTAIEMLAFMHVSLGQVELPGMDWIMMDPIKDQ